MTFLAFSSGKWSRNLVRNHITIKLIWRWRLHGRNDKKTLEIHIFWQCWLHVTEKALKLWIIIQRFFTISWEKWFYVMNTIQLQQFPNGVEVKLYVKKSLEIRFDVPIRIGCQNPYHSVPWDHKISISPSFHKSYILKYHKCPYHDHINCQKWVLKFIPPLFSNQLNVM